MKISDVVNGFKYAKDVQQIDGLRILFFDEQTSIKFWEIKKSLPVYYIDCVASVFRGLFNFSFLCFVVVILFEKKGRKLFTAAEVVRNGNNSFGIFDYNVFIEYGWIAS